MAVTRIKRLSDIADDTNEVSVEDVKNLIPSVDMGSVADRIKLYSHDPLLWKVIGLFALILLSLALLVVSVIWLNRQRKRRLTMNEYIAANLPKDKKRE